MKHLLVFCNKHQGDKLMTLNELYQGFKFTQRSDTRNIPVIPSPAIPAQGRVDLVYYEITKKLMTSQNRAEATIPCHLEVSHVLQVPKIDG